MKKILPLLAVLALVLSSCTGPSIDELREQDPEGYTACIHFGGGLISPEGAGALNMKKAAEHGAAASTTEISAAVATDESGAPKITDLEAFQKACEAQGFDFE